MSSAFNSAHHSGWKRHLWIAIASGMAFAGALLGLSFAINPDRHEVLFGLLQFAQFPGWFVCAYLLPGSFESINTTNYIEIAVPVNAALYALILFFVLRSRHRVGGFRSTASPMKRS